MGKKETALKVLKGEMDSSQCNYVCSSDSDCDSLTGPCVYCSSKGDGSCGTCESDEDDTGGTGLAGDDDTTKPSAAQISKKVFDVVLAPEEGHEKKAAAAAESLKVLKGEMDSSQCNYVCSSD